MSFAQDLLKGLEGAAHELAKEGADEVHVVENELAQLRPLLEGDVKQAEDFAKGLVQRLFAPQVAAGPGAPNPQ